MSCNNISLEELNALNKVVSHILGNKSLTISKKDNELAKECLRKFADSCPNWNDEQKKQMKILIDLL